ncbi:MAG: Na+/H+ antiporter NhaA [Fimbriimonadaceae bacterium]|nr:Na+/H+ antiporter NhaA [Fimbriimonadaceae bacterium]QYK55073.1 MAG: Na+/H+ antiporter NhaA [Fimbriimonadaceae bacterium]
MARKRFEPIGGKTPAERVLRPVVNFTARESSSGILLILATVIAMVWANSGWAASYHSLFHEEKLTVAFSDFFSLSYTLGHWVNDGLMAIFFFVVGLEIKREVLSGELRTPKRAMLPLLAATGGAVLPALIYLAINREGDLARGWGIPMATDIAFSLGVLALVASRAPLGLKVFLTAFAIVDDLIAVIVIALFYSGTISTYNLFSAAAALTVMVVFNKTGIRKAAPYFIFSLVTWFFVLKSGIHASIAGVLCAATIPATPRLSADQFVSRGRELIGVLVPQEATRLDPGAISELRARVYQANAPLEILEEDLHPWVAFFIMPVFALANAGVTLGSNWLQELTSPVALGIALALVVGKTVGISIFAKLGVMAKLSILPSGVRWPQIYATAALGGIGFTMSLFIATLAFPPGPILDAAKLGILMGSLVSGILGSVLLKFALRPSRHPHTAQASA